MFVKIVDDISLLSAKVWNGFIEHQPVECAKRADDYDRSHFSNPFISYQYFSALQLYNCIGADTGWIPRYFLLFEEADVAKHKNMHEDINSVDRKGNNRLTSIEPETASNQSTQNFDAANRSKIAGGDANFYGDHQANLEQISESSGKLVAVMPAFIKTHSYGEFVFDFVFAEAYENAGLRYYPKLIIASPFTPVSGPRLLCANKSYKSYLINAAIEYVKQNDISSVHWLFTDVEDTAVLKNNRLLIRNGCQFHWHNKGYQRFDDYLSDLNSKRRKQVKRERKIAAQAPLKIELLLGHQVNSQQWAAYHDLYASTYDRKWGKPNLTVEFFRAIGKTLGEQLLLIIAIDKDDHIVAGAHAFIDNDTVYGRNWGALQHYPMLHFEICYYRLIEYCINHGLSCFNAGAQGEHKIWRGFEPIATYSAHWFEDKNFHLGIARYLEKERYHNQRYMHEIDKHVPLSKPLSN